MIQTKEAISDQIVENAEKLYAWVEAQSLSAFEKGPEGKWTTGQHLEHLIRSVVPLNQAFLLPNVVYRLLFGKPNRPPRDYEGLVSRYKEKLSKGGQASGRYIPPVIPVSEKHALLNRFLKEYKLLARKTLRWQDSKLDHYLLPHPLLGKVTVREMLFFTTYHLQHHLEILNEQYER